MASNASKSSDWQKVSGFSGVVTLGKEPTFDEVYGAGFVPMIVAHDKAVQKIPSPTRIAFESVLFGPSGDAKPSTNRNGDVIKPEGVDLSKLSAACDLTTKKAIEEMSGKIIGFESAKQGECRVHRGPGSGDVVLLLPAPPDAKPDIIDEEHARLLAEAKITRDIEFVTDFQSLVPVAHSIALSKGWWEGGVEKRPIDEIVANYHAEVSEAWEEYRAGRMSTWYATGSAKPEGFWVEIADLLIRIADAIGAGREFTARSNYKIPYGHFAGDAMSFIVQLHFNIGCGGRVIPLCEKFASLNEVPLYKIVREKLRYNLSRPYRHGGKKA